MDSRYETMGRAGSGKKLVAGRRQLWSGMTDHAELTVERPGTLAKSTASQTLVGRIGPSSGRPPLQTTGGSYRRRSSGSPAMTKEGVHPGTSGVPPRTASRILRPTSSMRNRRASDSAVGSSSESAVRRSLSQGLALEYQQTSTKPLSRSDLAASSERLMSVARVVDHPGAVRSYSSFRGEKWGERRDSVPPSDQREQPPNHEVSKQMRSNGPVSLRASLLDLTGEGGTAPERFQQPWKVSDNPPPPPFPPQLAVLMTAVCEFQGMIQLHDHSRGDRERILGRIRSPDVSESSTTTVSQPSVCPSFMCRGSRPSSTLWRSYSVHQNL